MKEADLTEHVIAVVFEEWKVRYDRDPEGFQSQYEFAADAPSSYGEGAARYFLALKEEIDNG